MLLLASAATLPRCSRTHVYQARCRHFEKSRTHPAPAGFIEGAPAVACSLLGPSTRVATVLTVLDCVQRVFIRAFIHVIFVPRTCPL